MMFLNVLVGIGVAAFIITVISYFASKTKGLKELKSRREENKKAKEAKKNEKKVERKAVDWKECCKLTDSGDMLWGPEIMYKPYGVSGNYAGPIAINATKFVIGSKVKERKLPEKYPVQLLIDWEGVEDKHVLIERMLEDGEEYYEISNLAKTNPVKVLNPKSNVYEILNDEDVEVLEKGKSVSLLIGKMKLRIAMPDDIVGTGSFDIQPEDTNKKNSNQNRKTQERASSGILAEPEDIDA